MATFAERFEKKYKTNTTAGSSFASKFETQGAGKNILNDFYAKRQEEEQRKQQEALQRQQEAIQSFQQKQQERQDKLTKGNIFQKAGAFLSGAKEKVFGAETLPEIQGGSDYYQAVRDAQIAENEYKRNLAGRAGNLIAETGEKIKGAVKKKGEEYEKSVEERGRVGTQLEIQKGVVKNVAELASGAGKVALEFSPLTNFSGIRKLERFVGGQKVEEYLDKNTPEYLKKVDAFVDNNGLLNYKASYNNEIQKTGGEVAEIGSWFIPVTRLGQVAKLEKAISEIPKVARILGSTPKVVKVGGNLMYEVSKDIVDVAVLDAIRGKDWDEIKEDAKVAGIGAGVLRAGGGLVGAALSRVKENKLINAIDKSLSLNEEEKLAVRGLQQQGKTIDDIATEIIAKREQEGQDIYKAVEEVEQPKPTEVKPEIEGITKVQEPTKTTEVKQEQPKPTDIPAKTESPIIKRLNENLDEASKLDEKLNVTSHKEQLAKVERELLDNPEKVYNEAVFAGKDMSTSLRTTKLTALLENAKQKGDTKAIAEIGQALAEHGRRSGQEIEMIKAMIGDDPTNKALVELAKSKLQSVETRFKKLKSIAKEGEDVIQASNRVVKNKTKQILMKDRIAKVESARKLIKSLTC